MHKLVFAILAAMVGATLTASVPVFAQELSLVVNPRSGEIKIQNGPAASLNIDGYLLTSLAPRFDVADWDSLAGDGVDGWFESNSANNRLGEVNLTSFATIGMGASIDLGTPYLPFSPSQIGQLEPTLKFEYHISGGNTVVGEVVFVPQNNIVLVVDPTSGSAALQNQSQYDVTIDGYLIKSPANSLLPADWTSFAESGVAGAGWAESNAASNRLGEFNLLGSTFLAANGAPVSIGSPIDPGMLAAAADLALEFHIAGGGTITGGVVFAAAADPVLGDYNGDRSVDAADYTVWRDRLGQTFTLAGEKPNATTPGVVDQEDYMYWKSRFGATSGSGSAASGVSFVANTVPEPSTALIGGLCGLIASAGRRRRRLLPEYDC